MSPAYRSIVSVLAALAFAGNASGAWNEIPRPMASDGVSTDYSSASIAISGSVAVVGAPRDDDAGLSSPGDRS